MGVFISYLMLWRRGMRHENLTHAEDVIIVHRLADDESEAGSHLHKKKVDCASNFFSLLEV